MVQNYSKRIDILIEKLLGIFVLNFTKAYLHLKFPYVFSTS